MAVVGGYRRTGSGSAAGGGAELRGSGGAQRALRRHKFYLRNGFRDTNLYKKFDVVEMTIMMMGEGTFSMQDWDDIVSELRKYWTWET